METLNQGAVIQGQFVWGAKVIQSKRYNINEHNLIVVLCVSICTLEKLRILTICSARMMEEGVFSQ